MAAEIQSIAPDQSVVTGSGVSLRCSAKGVPAPEVVWTRNGSGDMLIKGKSTAILELKEVTKHDHEGVYRCSVNNSLGRDDADIKIKVVGGYLNPYIITYILRQ